MNLYVPPSWQNIYLTLMYLRGQTKATCSPKEQDFLILAVVLLQTIGLFHQRPEFRVSSNVYHGMLVMVGQPYFYGEIASLTEVCR